VRTGAAISSNTSRAYWELRAEQVMDRVFRPLDAEPQTSDPEAAADSIEVEVREAAPALAPTPSPRPLLWLLGGFTGLALISAGLLGLGWNRASQDLRQERTLRLLQGLRELGSDSASADATAGNAGNRGSGGSEQAPPPPPSEPWMEELAGLPAGGNGAAPLPVPLSGPLPGAAPPWAAPPPLPPLPAEAPELVGVVQSPGRVGAAIFRVNGSFTNANNGEGIGGSGWRLLNTSGDSALIERGGVTRRVSIGSGS
jgi:hypothetical protein